MLAASSNEALCSGVGNAAGCDALSLSLSLRVIRRNKLENKNIKIDLPDSGPHLGLVSVATTAAYEWIVQRELVKTIQSLKRGCPRIDCEAEIHYLHEPLLCPPKCCSPAGFRRGHRTEKEPVRL